MHVLSFRSLVVFLGLEAAWTGTVKAFDSIGAGSWFVVSALLVAGLLGWHNRARIRVWLTRVEPIHLVIVGLVGLMVFAAIALGGVLWHLRRPPLQAQAAVNQVAEATAPVSETPPPLPVENQIGRVGVFSPTATQPARVEARLTRSGTDARFYIELSFFHNGQWSPKSERIYIGKVDHFIADEVIWIPLFYRHTKENDVELFSWGPEERYTYNHAIWIRGRVSVVIFPDRLMQSSYFVLPPLLSGKITPVALEYFDDITKWETVDA